MKNLLPFLLFSLLLFTGMKFMNHFQQEKVSKAVLKKNPPDSLSMSPIPKAHIFSQKSKKKVLKASPVSYLQWLQPSAFKAHCYYNCKLLSSSKNGLCFFPGGLSIPASSKPVYDELWKRQFLEYL